MTTSGEVLRNIGIKQAVDNANSKINNWSDIAYDFLRDYCKTNNTFMAEDVRLASKTVVPEPPSARSWGAIFARAQRAKLITRIGFQSVKNPKAHCANASVWSTTNEIK
jgi:hypothetical protein